MGLGGIGPLQIIIVLVLVVLVFGTKKLRNLGGDLGASLKGFKKAMADDDKDKDPEQLSDEENNTIETTAEKVEEKH